MSVLIKPPDLLVIKKYTAANTDMLSGTQLATAPSDGEYLFYLASTVDTATLSITAPGQQQAQTDGVVLWANGVPKIGDMVPYRLRVKNGQKPTLALAGTTGTCFLIALFYAGG